MINASQLGQSWPLAAQARAWAGAVARRLPAVHWQRLIARLWWPFEAGTELPALYARGTDRPFPTYIPDRAGTDLAVALMTVQRRIAIQRLLILAVRVVWVALAVALVLMLARFLTTVSWPVLIGAVAAVLALAVLYQRSHRVTVWTAARVLDRHWRLGEELATAIELSVTPAPLRLAPKQVARALATMLELRASHRVRPRLPWAELQVASAVALLVAGMALFAGPAERLTPPAIPFGPDGLTTVSVDQLGLTDPELRAQLGQGDGYVDDQYPYGGDYPGMDLSGIDPEALRQAAELSNRSAKELEQIADAFKDAAVTSQAAQQIQAGDYAAAAQQIADLAKSIDSLSPEARRDLAERLKQAAENVQPLDPELARRLEQAAKALASRSDRAAAQGLEDLSKAIAETGKNVIPQSQLGEAWGDMNDISGSINDDGPSRGSSSKAGKNGAGALGEGDPGEHGFDSVNSTLAIGGLIGGPAEDGSGGAGAGQGSGADGEGAKPRLNPNGDRVVVPADQASGPIAPRLGKGQSGQPDVITTGPGTTGPGNKPQSNLPITTGFDPNRVPRSLRAVVEGYFKGLK